MKKTRFFSVLTSAAALAFACTGISASAVETTISVPDDTSIVTEETNLEDMNLSDLVSMLGSASENSTAETTVSDENATSDDFTSDFYDTSGNATLIQSEKILYDSEEMQFISVTTKDGHVFYVLINYSAESGENNVYFLNKVDDYDLYALLYAGDEESSDSSITPEDVRQAAEQANGRVSNNPEKAESAETTASKTAESNTASPVRSSGNMMPLLLVVGVVTVAAAGFLGFKFLKKKPKKSADTDSSDEEIEWYDDNEINEDEE